jgi:hypothetical protein
MLLEYSTPELLAAVSDETLNEDETEGAARLFAGWHFNHSRPQDNALLPADLKRHLLQHSLKSTDKDKRERAEGSRDIGGSDFGSCTIGRPYRTQDRILRLSKLAGATLSLDMEGTCSMRKSTKLLLTMILIGCVHAGILFVWYGRKWYWSNIWAAHIWLLLPSCAAFCLYYFSLSTAGILAEPFRRGKQATISVAATLVSLYVGALFSLNTYGE